MIVGSSPDDNLDCESLGMCANWELSSPTASVYLDPARFP
jgi:hypothetical protein